MKAQKISFYAKNDIKLIEDRLAALAGVFMREEVYYNKFVDGKIVSETLYRYSVYAWDDICHKICDGLGKLAGDLVKRNGWDFVPLEISEVEVGDVVNIGESTSVLGLSVQG